MGSSHSHKSDEPKPNHQTNDAKKPKKSFWSRIRGKKSSQVYGEESHSESKDSISKDEVKTCPEIAGQNSDEAIINIPDTDNDNIDSPCPTKPAMSKLESRTRTAYIVDAQVVDETQIWREGFAYTPFQLIDALVNDAHPELNEPIKKLTVYREKSGLKILSHVFVLIETDKRFFSLERMPGLTILQECNKANVDAVLQFMLRDKRPSQMRPAIDVLEGSGTVADVLINLLKVNVIPREYHLFSNNCQRLAAKVVKHHNTQGIRMKWLFRQVKDRQTAC